MSGPGWLHIPCAPVLSCELPSSSSSTTLTTGLPDAQSLWAKSEDSPLLEPQAGVERQAYRFPRLRKVSSPQVLPAASVQNSNDQIDLCVHNITQGTWGNVDSLGAPSTQGTMGLERITWSFQNDFLFDPLPTPSKNHSDGQRHHHKLGYSQDLSQA